jgi:hypothetical protein
LLTSDTSSPSHDSSPTDSHSIVKEPMKKKCKCLAMPVWNHHLWSTNLVRLRLIVDAWSDCPWIKHSRLAMADSQTF